MTAVTEAMTAYQQDMGVREKVSRILARENGAPNYTEDDWAIFVYQADQIIEVIRTAPPPPTQGRSHDK